MGELDTVPAVDRPDLLAPAVAAALAGLDGLADQVSVAEIDPDLADTAAFCERYGVGLAESANCVLISGRRGGETKFAACMVLATTRADVNGVVRRELDVRMASFAARDVAVAETERGESSHVAARSAATRHKDRPLQPMRRMALLQAFGYAARLALAFGRGVLRSQPRRPARPTSRSMVLRRRHQPL